MFTNNFLDRTDTRAQFSCNCTNCGASVFKTAFLSSVNIISYHCNTPPDSANVIINRPPSRTIQDMWTWQVILQRCNKSIMNFSTVKTPSVKRNSIIIRRFFTVPSLFTPGPIAPCSESSNKTLLNSLPGTFTPRSELARELSFPASLCDWFAALASTVLHTLSFVVLIYWWWCVTARIRVVLINY